MVELRAVENAQLKDTGYGQSHLAGLVDHFSRDRPVSEHRDPYTLGSELPLIGHEKRGSAAAGLADG